VNLSIEILSGRIGGNVLELCFGRFGTVVYRNVCLKILMFVAFAKMKNYLPKLFAKAITSSAQIGLACC